MILHKKPRQFFTTEELEAKLTGRFVFDVESYPNYFLVAFKCLETGKYAYFECKNDDPIATNWLYWFLTAFCLVGFYCRKYDIPIIGIALTGTNRASHLHAATQRMIVDNVNERNVAEEFGSNLPSGVNCIDLQEVAPLKGSLKNYGARIHAPKIQDLPYDPNTVLTLEEMAIVREYCFNDLDITELVCIQLNEHLELRANLSREFEQDFRSLSDAQIAEAIIKSELEKVTGKKIKRPGFDSLVKTSFRYVPPAYVAFSSNELQTMLAEICEAKFYVDESGHVICPKNIDGRKVSIGNRQYTIGVGGLHSVEQRQTFVKTDNMRILDRDVTGYYPNLILKNKFAPAHLGDAFLIAFQAIVDKRYAAKKEGRKAEADGLKIASNGTFGKTSDPYSIIYSPTVTIHTTITGYLSLMMQIEMMVGAGFEVISANTDGVVTLCPQEKYAEFCAVIAQWERVTGMETEETEYAGLYSRDVNNYIAIKLDGKHKAKGQYSEFGSAHNSPLSKNPTNFVVMDAVIAHLTKGVPVETAVKDCQDFRRFITSMNVAGGANKDGKPLGKVVRWYYATGEVGNIVGNVRGNKVPLSDGGKPCMEMPFFMPDDIDYDRYAAVATKILEDIGFQQRKNEQLTLLT